MAWALIATLGTAAGILAVALAGVVLMASRTRANRWLAALLVAEGVLQSTAVLNQAVASVWLDLAFIVSASLVPALALAVLAPLDTPVVAWLRRPRALVAAFALGAVFMAFGSYVTVVRHYVDASIDDSFLAGAAFLLILGSIGVSYVFSLVASISAFRRASPGTLARARARAFAIAFGTRDAAMGIFLATIIIGFAVLGQEYDGQLDYLPSAATIVYVLLLAYGILRTQLFDIDLKIKLGIQRSTVVTAMIVVVFAAAKVAEFYLNSTFGFVAGGVAAGMMLFVAPRLNKVGEKLAATALPRVHDTPEYLASRKLEVYRAAVETAWEDGSLTPQERAILDRLREKLEIAPAEAYGVEADVTRALRGHATAAAPAQG